MTALADLPQFCAPVYAILCGAVICFAAGGGLAVGLLTWINKPDLLESEKSAADAAWGVEHATLLNASLAEGWALKCSQPAARAALLDFASTLRDNVQRLGTRT